MMQVFSIAAAEWQLWLRSRVALLALLAVSVLLVAASILTATRMADERHQRLHQQEAAEETFLAQPARHPHRMVHYGHYVFRTPTPLAIIDPGVDAVTGQSIFLEGHRQNTAMFADTRASANLGGFRALSPAFVYQVFVPLLLIALGHGVFVREREARTLAPLLAQGVSGNTLYLGKMLSLLGLSAVLLSPLAVLAVIATAFGETAATGLALAGTYALYLLVWSALIVLLSALVKSRGLALGLLVFVWLAWVLVIPRIAVASASASVSAPGKLETDFQMYADLRELGDGHNAADPAFAELRANLLAEYDVASVEELPVNFRGIVAQTAEADLTVVLNDYAERRMTAEAEQARHASTFGWLSPSLAIASSSRSLAGVDLNTHHRFLREAEAVRFDFVQGLNEVHAEQLDYSDDINRSSDPEAERRTRVSPDNWAVLDDFEFAPAPAKDRFAAASTATSMLIAWLFGLVVAGFVSTRVMKP